MQRRRLKAEGGAYFPQPVTGVRCIPSGCTLLDCVLGGGWAVGRVANIVGDKSSGKTLCAIEACANFASLYPKGKIWYREAEAAFDEAYAAELGLPTKRVDFGPKGLDTTWDTVEDIFEDLEKCIEVSEKTGAPGLYIIDSLDALSSRAELDRAVDKGSFGLEKPKLLGKLFRQLIRRLKNANVCVLVISQVRDKIGVVFGEKHTRTGGRALDFYASQILWLHHIQNLYRTAGTVKRATGVRIKAKCKKNKVGMPHRECEFEITFGYGIRDFEASLDWLAEVKALNGLLLAEKDVPAYVVRVAKMERAELVQQHKAVREVTLAAWKEVEGRFAPKSRKYG